jgi:hypothetical protein
MKKKGSRKKDWSKWDIFWQIRVKQSYWFRYIRYGLLPRMRRPFMPTYWKWKRKWGEFWVKVFDHRCRECGVWLRYDWMLIFGLCPKCHKMHEASYGRGRHEETD